VVEQQRRVLDSCLMQFYQAKWKYPEVAT